MKRKELASGSESQQPCGVHTLHVHRTEAEMLEPGGGGGWYSTGRRGAAGCGAPQPRN